MLLALTLFTLTATAAERSIAEKKQAAMRAIATLQKAKAMPSSAGIKELKVMTELSVFGYDGGGFAVISNDDRNEAVIGYSDKAFSAGNLPDGLQWWLDAADKALSAALSYTRDTDLTPSEYGYKASVASFVTARWGQSDPYNRQCPLSGTSRTLTGCVATAMAQVLNYYKYPAGIDRKVLPGYGVIEGSYDWTNMADTYLTDGNGTPQFTDAQANAVAKLMFHCGATVSMNYGVSASGAYGYNIPEALIKTFKYNENLTYRFRAIHTQKEWMGMIFKELSNGRPILYGAADASFGGHAFVFDGYDSNGFVHVNWGWEGGSDGYYDVALLNPQNYHFTEQQDMVTGIALPGVEIEKSWELGTMGSNLDLSLSGNTLTVDMTGGYTIYNLNGGTSFWGNIMLVLDNNGTPSEIGTIATGVRVAAPADGGYSGATIAASKSFDVPSDLPDGEYEVCLGFKETFSTTGDIYRMYYPDGVTGSYTLTKRDGSLTLSEGHTSGIATITTTSRDTDDDRIYTIDGRYVGKDLNALGKGVYIVKGKKVVKSKN